MTQAILVTGTDTGVGKTAVTCGILRAMRAKGVRTGAFKPAESGWNGSSPWPPDGGALAQAAGMSLPREAIVPYVFRDAVAPSVAARHGRSPIRLRTLDAAFRKVREAHEITFVEGAGGLAVPLTDRTTMADLAARWRLPLLIVARAGLGTINHTVLTVRHAQERGLRVVGVILNRASTNPGLAERTNAAEIERWSGARVLGAVPEVAGVDVDAGRTEPMREAVTKHLDLGRLWKLSRNGG